MGSETVEDLAQKISDMSAFEIKNFKQIKIDVYRTQPDIKFVASQLFQTMMIRLLFVWSMQNPTTAYV